MLTEDFFCDTDVVRVARALIGKVLCAHFSGVLTSARIVETEAYGGVYDKASHAYKGRRTSRTEPMFHKGGCAYVYLCYGIHHLFNIVTGDAEQADAVLIRAAEPLQGEATMQQRRNHVHRKLLSYGPGTLSQALGITVQCSGYSLQGPWIWLEEDNWRCPSDQIVATTRIGIDYAEEDAQRPWRFYYSKSPFAKHLSSHA